MQLWPQNWRWLKSLSEDWSCSFVFASGSLTRFWKNADIVGEERLDLPDLVSSALTARLNAAEGNRVAYRTLGRLAGLEAILKAVSAAPGPRLLLLNTVQSAAVIARYMQEEKKDLLHISTALCPTDRAVMFERIMTRLTEPRDSDWTLVATSLVEAGVDLSFRSAFRERFSAASLIQVGGRVNRHGELKEEPAVVYDFFFDSGPLLRRHPGAKVSGEVLGELFAEGLLDSNFDPSDFVTLAQRRELRSAGNGSIGKPLLQAERCNDYPLVAKLGRVIDADTHLVIVDPRLRDDIESRKPVIARDLLAGSVQIWSKNISNFALPQIRGRSDIFWWPYEYDPQLLGYMKGALKLLSIQAGDSLII